MKKTIVKAKLPSRTDFVSALEEIDFKFAAPYWQHDRIFVPRNFDRSKTQPRLSLRTIVKGADKAIYALVLRRHFENSHMDLINATPVTDYAEAAHILYQLGYELKYEVARRREAILSKSTLMKSTLFRATTPKSNPSLTTKTTPKNLTKIFARPSKCSACQNPALLPILTASFLNLRRPSSKSACRTTKHVSF